MKNPRHKPQPLNALKAAIAIACLLCAGSAKATSTGYSIGLNFGSDEPDGAGTAALATNEVAGLAEIKQANWNNLPGAASAAPEAVVADNAGVRVTTETTVEWTCPNTWSSTGRGEENNGFAAGPDRDLMTGYVDTGDATTTTVTIMGVPAELTSGGYSIYVYLLGGVPNKGGGYRILNADDQSELAPYLLGDCIANPSTYIRDPGLTHQDQGNYLVFKGMTATNIVIEATTAGGMGAGSGPRAPINAIQLAQVPDMLIVGGLQASLTGIQFTVENSGRAVLTNLVLKFDNVTVTPTSTSFADGLTTVIYDVPTPPLASGSIHQVDVEAKDTLNRIFTFTSSVTAPTYPTVSANLKVTGTPSDPGMNVRTHWIKEQEVTGFTGRYPGNENFTRNAEHQLANGYIDASTGLPYPNFADPTSTNVLVVNWEQFGADIDANNNDNFNSVEPADAPIPNDPIPGIPAGDGGLDTMDNIVVETTAYLQLKKGVYRMGVNSDDGFKVTVAPGQPSVTGIVIGEFDNGRGAADSLFDFAVEEDGVYPFRLLWWEGGGGANIEWFTVDSATGEKILVNGTHANAVKAFRTATDRASLASAMPANGFESASRTAGIRAELVDGATTVVDGSVKLILNGKDITADSQIVNGATTTVTFVPAAPWLPDSSFNWQLVWTESTTPPTTWTNSFTFGTARLAPDDLPAVGAFWIEAEDWDYGDGQTIPDASIMPYAGGAYDGLAGTLNVDYFDDQNDNDPGINYVYRTDQRPNHANVTGNQTARFGIDRPGTTDLTINYRIGWVGNFWGNYTREVPAGVYTAYAALSIDNSNVDAMQADLDIVTEGVGTSTQTLKRLGTFFGRGNGAWGSNELAPLRTPQGDTAIFKITNTNATTFRVTARSGDFDWIVLIPVTNAPPQLVSVDPNSLLFAVSRDAVLKWTYEDFSTSVNAASVALKINGVAAPSAQVTVASADGLTTITYDPPGLFEIGKTTTYELSFNDTAGKPFVKTGSFLANFIVDAPQGMFLIEGEDFNFDGGQIKTEANVMPYLGNAYDGLAATVDIDYGRGDAEASGNIYRLNETPNVPLGTDGDLIRARDAAGAATWTLTASYRLGWAGSDNGAARWQNYTRTIPAGDYQIWASASYGEAPSAASIRIDHNLRKVTSDPTTTNQTTELIGHFRAPATGGWGANQLIPLRSTTSTSGDAAVVSLGGLTTLRYEYPSADFDYMMLVPVTVGPAKPAFTSIKKNADGTITVEWTGGGTLEAAPTVLGPWAAVTGAASPYTFTPDAGQQMLFGRIKR